jgi:hypothetical protein
LYSCCIGVVNLTFFILFTWQNSHVTTRLKSKGFFIFYILFFIYVVIASSFSLRGNLYKLFRISGYQASQLGHPIPSTILVISKIKRKKKGGSRSMNHFPFSIHIGHVE